MSTARFAHEERLRAALARRHFAHEEGLRAAIGASRLAADPPDAYVGQPERSAYLAGWLTGRRHLAAPTVDVDPLRAAHVGIRPAYMAHGAPTPGAAPDPFDGVRHQVKRGRGSKGQPTAQVTRRGVVRGVTGRMHWNDAAPRASEATDVRQVLGEYLERTTGDDVTALDLTRWADAIIGDHVPRLLGTDAVSWEQVVRAGEGSVDEYGIAWHNPYLGDGVTVGRGVVSAPTRGGLLRRYRANIVDMDRCAAWIDRLRAVNGATAIECAPRGITGRKVATKRRTARLRLPRSTRQGDPVACDIGPADVDATTPAYVAAFGGTRLLAPAADLDHMWIGHRLVERPHGTRKARTIKRDVARVKRATRTVADHEVTSPDALGPIIDALAPGARVTFTMGTLRGTITRGNAGKLAATVRDGRTPVATVRGVRTSLAVTRQLTTQLTR